MFVMVELSESEVARLRRLRRVTENLWFWQGLRFAPLSLTFLAAAITFGMGNTDRPLAIVILAVGVFAAFVLIQWADGHYKRGQGQVRGVQGLHARRSQMKWFIIYPAMFVSLVIDFTFGWPVFITGPVWALALLLYRASTGGGRNHYFGLAAALLALTIAPMVTQLRGDALASLFFSVVALCYAVAGVLDDLELRQVLRNGASATA
jgi:hypothetical protein